MVVRKKIFLLSFLFISVFFSTAQDQGRILQKATAAYQDLAFYDAARLYEQYYFQIGQDQKIILKIADCYWKMRQYDMSKSWYDRVKKDSVVLNDTIIHRLSELSAMSGEYQKASEILVNAKQFKRRREGFNDPGGFLKDSADWTIGYPRINTRKYREFSPLIIGSSLIWSTNEPNGKYTDDTYSWDANGFVRQRYLKSTKGLKVDPIPSSRSLSDTQKMDQKKIARIYDGADVSIRTRSVKTLLNSKRKAQNSEADQLKFSNGLHFNVAHATASENSSKIYLTVNQQKKAGFGSLRSMGIIESDMKGDLISNHVFLDIKSVDSTASNILNIHGAIDPRGQYLVFSSNRPGGKGGYDLYFIEKSIDNKWSSPLPLDQLNTEGDEVFPIFSPNGDLYFSSDGHPGLGGLDIYLVKSMATPYNMGLIFKDPEHLSYPINSDHDDFSMVMQKDQEHGFFTSDRYGSDDIFSFEFSKKYITIKGSVVEKNSTILPENILVVLYETGKDGSVQLVDSVSTDRNGIYTFLSARPNREYVIKIFEPVKEGGIQDVEIIKTSTDPAGIKIGPAVATIEYTKSVSSSNDHDTILHEKVKGSKDILDAFTIRENELAFKQRSATDSFFAIVYFGFDRYKLTSKALRIIDSVIDYMKINPLNKFILLGHSDEVGDINYNIELSKRRVFEVTKYIGSKGIDTQRLKLSYYGEQRPAQSYDFYKKYLRLNRRVEFVLIKNTTN